MRLINFPAGEACERGRKLVSWNRWAMLLFDSEADVDGKRGGNEVTKCNVAFIYHAILTTAIVLQTES